MSAGTMLDVPRVLVEHFGYGTLSGAVEIWPPDDAHADMLELGEAWARAMGGEDPVQISAGALVALYHYAGLLFGYYGHPYKLVAIRRRPKEEQCWCCVAIAELVIDAKAIAKACQYEQECFPIEASS